MIKNDIQMKRVLARIDQLLHEISDLELGTPAREREFFASHLRKELESLRADVDQYSRLRTDPFDVVIETELREPVLLENVGSLLARLRIAAKLSQTEMAEKLGWHQSNLSRFESDNYSSQTLVKISEYVSALGVFLHVVPSLTEKPAEVNHYLAPVALTPRALTAQLDYLVTSTDAALASAPSSAQFSAIASQATTPATFPEGYSRETLQVNVAQVAT